MKNSCIILLVLLTGCGGSLSDEQRKKLREGMDQQQIVKVSDAEIIATALDQGQVIFNDLKKIQFNKTKIDSLEKAHNVRITLLVPGASNALAIEQELIDAYINGLATGSVQENIQKVWTDTERTAYDSILYTQPKLNKRSDGVEELEGIWNIYMAKKDVVLNFGKQHQ